MQNEVIWVISKWRFWVIDHAICISTRKVFNINFTITLHFLLNPKLLWTFFMEQFLLFAEYYFHKYVQSLLALLFVIALQAFRAFLSQVPYVATCFACFACFVCFECFTCPRAFIFYVLYMHSAFYGPYTSSVFTCFVYSHYFTCLTCPNFLRASRALHAFIFLRA